MNIVPHPDRNEVIGWILPPRCAARFTGELLWKYGMTRFVGHGIEPNPDADRVYMNVRNPISRMMSWYRLCRSVSGFDMDFEPFIENLHSGEHDLVFTNVFHVDDDDKIRYPTPLSNYITKLGRMPDRVLYQETLNADLEEAGFPVLDHVWEPEQKEYELDFTRKDVEDNQRICEIIETYYKDDFDNFGYIRRNTL